MANAILQSQRSFTTDNPERKIIMNSQVSFTHEQAKRASQIIIDLMKQRRFFLAKENTLDSKIFSECINFDKFLRDFYTLQANLAGGKIREKEKELGIIPPVLKEGQKIAKISFYKGGMEIVGVYPIKKFTEFIPESYDVLYSEIFKMCHGDVEDIPPRQLSGKKNYVKILTHHLWGELQEIKRAENGIVFIMGTQFDPDCEENFKTLKQKVGDLISCPEGLAYLFFKNECVDRLMMHDYVLFDTDIQNHTRVSHWNDEKGPYLSFGKSGGYDCKIKFVCVT